MAEEAKWVTFVSDSDDEEALSFCNLPVAAHDKENTEVVQLSPAMDEQFEFRIVGINGDLSSEKRVDMCAAEDVFFHGQLLPLGPTQTVHRSDSTASFNFESSSSLSRSLSSNSCGSSSDAPSLQRIRSSALYAYPSPSPRVTPARRNCGVSGGGRRNAGSAPAVWGLLRLGVVMAPEMELQDIRVRRASVAGPKVVRHNGVVNIEERGSAVWRLLAGGGLMGCKCSPEDAVSKKVTAGKKKKKKKGRSTFAGLTDGRERMFEWLEELSLGRRAVDQLVVELH